MGLVFPQSSSGSQLQAVNLLFFSFSYCNYRFSLRTTHYIGRGTLYVLPYVDLIQVSSPRSWKQLSLKTQQSKPCRNGCPSRYSQTKSHSIFSNNWAFPTKGKNTRSFCIRLALTLWTRIPLPFNRSGMARSGCTALQIVAANLTFFRQPTSRKWESAEEG